MPRISDSSVRDPQGAADQSLRNAILDNESQNYDLINENDVNSSYIYINFDHFLYLIVMS